MPTEMEEFSERFLKGLAYPNKRLNKSNIDWEENKFCMLISAAKEILPSSSTTKAKIARGEVKKGTLTGARYRMIGKVHRSGMLIIRVVDIETAFGVVSIMEEIPTDEASMIKLCRGMMLKIPSLGE